MKKIQSFKNHNKKIDFNTESKNCLKKKAIITDTNTVISYLTVFILLLNPIIPYIILVECTMSTISIVVNSLAMELRIDSPSLSTTHDLLKSVPYLFQKCADHINIKLSQPV